MMTFLVGTCGKGIADILWSVFQPLPSRKKLRARMSRPLSTYQPQQVRPCCRNDTSPPSVMPSLP